MINLIPPEGQKAIRREYVLRVASTFGLLFGFLALLIAGAHIPTYVLINVQIKTLESEAERGSERDAQVMTAEAEVSRVAQIISRLKTTEKYTGVVKFIDEIEDKTTERVALNTFILNANPKSKKLETIQVQGTAEDRASLADFKKSLENSELFSKAEIPISDLARDVELTFTVTLTLVTPL